MYTIDQIITKINAERGIDSRFPVRLIFVDDLIRYQSLIDKLKKVSDKVINISEFCSSEDTYPKLSKLEKVIEQNQGIVLLLSMGEFLRFRIKRECDPQDAQFPSFWQMQFGSTSKTRVITPMFACRDLFDRVVPFLDDRQTDNVWELPLKQPLHSHYSMSVYSPNFKESIKSPVIGFRDWLNNWFNEFLDKKDVSVVTNLNKNVENTSGIIDVKVINNPFVYVSSRILDGNRIKREWASDNQWIKIIPDLIEDEPFKNTIENILNVQVFEPVSIIARWDVLSQFQRQLVWIWYQLDPGDDYVGFVFRNIDRVEGFEKAFRDMIIMHTSRSDWIKQRNALINHLKNVYFDNHFFTLLDSVAIPDIKLSLLSYQSDQERAYAINTVSNWLKKGALIDTVMEVLAGQFPLFETYISQDIEDHFEVSEYFKWYRLHKITNRVPDAPPPNINLDRFKSRFSLLNKYQTKDCFMLWIDGMGVEWLPLLLHQIRSTNDEIDIKYEIGTSLLPTETKFNEQWKELDISYDKWNRLDELAHKGLPDNKDYFACIEHQLRIISEVAVKAISLLKEHENVIITADHGSSRLAALSFHKSFGIKPPSKSIVRNYGRYCELNAPLSSIDNLAFVRKVKMDDKEYLVMTSHEHYSISGNPAGGNDEERASCGEIHGGMTPEEYLVPVVVLHNQNLLPKIDYVVKNKEVFRVSGKATIELQFSEEVSSLEVKAGNITGVCQKKDPFLWSVYFIDVNIDDYQITVIANSHLIDQKAIFSVKARGIEVDNDPFDNF